MPSTTSFTTDPCNAVSAMKVNGRVLILDDNHRVAALGAALLLPEATLKAKGWRSVAAEQAIWVGTQKNGEAPLT